MRRLGLLLFLAGFVLLLGVAFWFETTETDVFAQAYDSVPQQQTFTRKEVQERLDALFAGVHFHQVWIIIPGFLMLGGGLMLLKRP